MVARYIAKKDQSNKYKKIKSKIWYNTMILLKLIVCYMFWEDYSVVKSLVLE